MPFKPGHKLSKGRPSGSKNKRTEVQAIADRIGVMPLEVLLMFAKGDWEGLGYKNEKTTKWTASGIEYEEEVIRPDMRLKAASDAVPYFHAKQKAIEHTFDEYTQDLLRQANELKQMSVEELMKVIDEETEKLNKGK